MIPCSLFLVSAFATMAALLLFRLTSSRPRRELLWRQLWANMFAIRLYADEPRFVFESLLGVITANVKLLISALPALITMSVIGIVMYGPLDRLFGVAPLAVSTPGLLTARLKHFDGTWPDLRLETPDWITVDSPPVHVFAEREISWRIRVRKASLGVVKVIAGSDIAGATIDTRPWPAYVRLFRSRVAAGPISDVYTPAPEAAISIFGVSLNWVWWFSIFSILLALPLHWLLSR